MNVQKVSPLFIENVASTPTVQIIGNRFFNFDAPVEVWNSNAVRFTGNTFSGFEVEDTNALPPCISSIAGWLLKK